MMDRRVDHRLLCADLVDVQWRDVTGRLRRGVANLEDISISGACLQVDRPIPLGTPYKISYPNGLLAGTVKYCVFREIGYFLGVEFDPGTRWSRNQFRPQHLLDPQRLAVRAGNKARNEAAPEPAA